MKVHLIRLGSVAAVLAGALRALTSFLPPTTDRIMTLYLIVDVLLLFGCVGLYEFQRVKIRFLETLALLLEILGGLVLIARDLALLRSEVYPIGALLFAIGVDLFAIGSWRFQNIPAVDTYALDSLYGHGTDRVFHSKSRRSIRGIWHPLWDWIHERRHLDMATIKRQGITNVRPLSGGPQGWLERGYPVVSRAS